MVRLKSDSIFSNPGHSVSEDVRHKKNVSIAGSVEKFSVGIVKVLLSFKL